MLTNCVSTKATMNQLRQDIGDDDVDQLGQDEDQDQLWQDDPLSSSQQTCCEWWEWLRGCENGYGGRTKVRTKHDRDGFQIHAQSEKKTLI